MFAYPRAAEVAVGVAQIALPIPYPMGYVNTYLLLPGPGSAANPVLVDAGIDTPEAREALIQGLQMFGLVPSDLERLVITHHHPDHYGLSGWIEAQGVPVFMLEQEFRAGHRMWLDNSHWPQAQRALFLRHGLPVELVDYLVGLNRQTRTLIRPPQQPQTLVSGQRVELAGQQFQVHWTPGHADGHMVLLRDDGWLLAGDHLLERITPNISLWARGRPNPLADFLDSLKLLALLEPQQALVGHYGPVLEQPLLRTAQLLEHHRERLAFLLATLQQPATAWGASFLLFPGQMTPENRRFAFAETLAHLEYLVSAGQVVRLEETPLRYAPA